MIHVLEKKFRTYFPKRVNNLKIYKKAVAEKTGIEIGGPSQIFQKKGLLPLYKDIKSLDGVNFSNNTMWEGQIFEGKSYQFGDKTGNQYILDSVDLSKIKSESYDFLLSCHSLEHIANPIRALKEWIRILKPAGHIIIVLPHKDKTFDKNRPITRIEHLIKDYFVNTEEDDETHFEEVLNLHDIKADYGIESVTQFQERVKLNFYNRSIHHHVFNARLTGELLNYVELQILDLNNTSNNIFAIAQKCNTKCNNEFFLSGQNKVYSDVKYPSDYKK